MSAPEDYEEEAAFYGRALEEACQGPARTLVELGSGGGNNASHLKSRFKMVLVEPSAGMLKVSRALNPECEHVQGDMRTVRLNRQFDLVFVHDAVCYMTTESDLRQAIETAFMHCRPGGAALFAPDHLLENFRPSSDHGGHDSATHGLRYLEWTWDPDPIGHNVSGRLRVPAAEPRRFRASGARPSRRRSLPARSLAAPAVGRRLRTARPPLRPLRTRTWLVRSVRCDEENLTGVHDDGSHEGSGRGFRTTVQPRVQTRVLDGDTVRAERAGRLGATSELRDGDSLKTAS